MIVQATNLTTIRNGYHGPPTATLDWCEENYQFSHYIAEMANTVSNLATVGFALFGLLRCNAEKLPMRFALGYLGIALIGVGSAYFHGTLLFQAQLADELPMIYVASMPLWLLFDLDTKFDMKTRRTRILGYSVVAFDVLFTWSYYLYRNPVYHQMVFGTMLFTVAGRIYFVITRSPHGRRISPENKRLIGRIFTSGVAQFSFAFLVWNLDNIFCNTLTMWKIRIGWPAAFLLEGHSWWHVFTASGTYFKYIGIQYLSLCVKDDQRNYTLSSKWGLPYVKRVDKKSR